MPKAKPKSNRMAKVYLLCLVLGCSAFAQLPDAPSAVKHENPYKPDWTFYATTGAHIAATDVDVRFVQHCERIRTCLEGNPGKDRWSHRWPEIALGAAVTYSCQVILTGHKYWRRLACPIPVLLWSAYQAIDGTKVHY
jgi:hypothetical protein